jgi:hypothetical protein
VKTLACERETTSKIFSNSIQSSERKSIHNSEDKIDLQELSGRDRERILHSAKSCTNTVNHISTAMRKNFGEQNNYIKNYDPSTGCN